ASDSPQIKYSNYNRYGPHPRTWSPVQSVNATLATTEDAPSIALSSLPVSFEAMMLVWNSTENQILYSTFNGETEAWITPASVNNGAGEGRLGTILSVTSGFVRRTATVMVWGINQISSYFFDGNAWHATSPVLQPAGTVNVSNPSISPLIFFG